MKDAQSQNTQHSVNVKSPILSVEYVCLTSSTLSCFVLFLKTHNKPLSESDFIMTYGPRGLSFRVQTSWAHGVYSDALYFYNRGDKVMVSKTHFHSE